MTEQKKTEKAPEVRLTIADVTRKLGNDVMLEIQNKQKNGLVFPDGYSVQNAITSAMFQIKDVKDKDGNLALAVCSENSIKLALWDMASKGLYPNKKHVYWIVYGKNLTMFES